MKALEEILFWRNSFFSPFFKLQSLTKNERTNRKTHSPVRLSIYRTYARVTFTGKWILSAVLVVVNLRLQGCRLSDFTNKSRKSTFIRRLIFQIYLPNILRHWKPDIHVQKYTTTGWIHIVYSTLHNNKCVFQEFRVSVVGWCQAAGLRVSLPLSSTCSVKAENSLNQCVSKPFFKHADLYLFELFKCWKSYCINNKTMLFFTQ